MCGRAEVRLTTYLDLWIRKEIMGDKPFLYTEEDVKRIAYNIYCWREARGMPGNDKTDYHEAEERCKKWWTPKGVNT